MRAFLMAFAGVALSAALAASAEDQPLHAVDGGHTSAKVVAVYLTGDGGWAPFDQRVVADLAKAGVPTVALDTGDYFSTMRDPAGAASELGAVASRALAQWRADKLIVVGYSFGADVAPFMINRMAPDLRARVERVALMGPSDQAPFQVTMAERVGLANPGARPTKPELAGLTRAGIPIVCLYGANDHDAICSSIQGRGVTATALAGGHGFRDDDQAVAHAILAP